MTALVVVNPLAAAAYDAPRALPAGAVFENLGGARVRVLPGGDVAEVLPPGHPRGGAASDPQNARP